MNQPAMAFKLAPGVKWYAAFWAADGFSCIYHGMPGTPWYLEVVVKSLSIIPDNHWQSWQNTFATNVDRLLSTLKSL
jgi:hypothetical protein